MSGCSTPGPGDDEVGAGPRRLLFLGDSITNGSAAASFSLSFAPLTLGMVGQVAARPDSFVGGYPGTTSSFILEKLREHRSLNPDLVILLAGLNDAAQGVPLSSTKSNLLQAVQEVGAERCVVGIPPVPRGATPADMQSLLGLQSWLLRERGLPDAVTIVDFGAMLRAPDSPEIDQRLCDPDGVHPNGLGHQVMARGLARSLIGFRGPLKAAGLVERADGLNRFPDPLNAAPDPSNTWTVIDAQPSIRTGARFVAGSPEFLRAGRWLELDCATGPEAGTVQLASVPCDVSDARGRRLVLCCQSEVEVVSGSWLDDVSADASGVSLGLLNSTGQFVAQSTPFLGNAGYASETDARVARWGPVAYPVTLEPSADAVSISIAGKLAPNSRVLIRVGCLGLFYEDLLPGSFRAAPSTEVQQLS